MSDGSMEGFWHNKGIKMIFDSQNAMVTLA